MVAPHAPLMSKEIDPTWRWGHANPDVIVQLHVVNHFTPLLNPATGPDALNPDIKKRAQAFVSRPMDTLRAGLPAVDSEEEMGEFSFRRDSTDFCNTEVTVRVCLFS
jgi:hypothetical protein